MYSNSIKEIEEFPGYFANKQGEIFSNKRGRFKKLRLVDNSSGYFCVTIYSDKPRVITVHRLVMMAFHGIKSTRKIQINHKDGNKKNNAISNLEFVSPKENIQHAIRTGLRDLLGEKNPSSKLTEQMILEIKKLLLIGGPHGFRAQIARQFGVTKELIYAIQRGKVWAHLNQPTGG